MISPALCPTLTLLLIIGTVFTITLTENLQLADGLSATGSKIVASLDVGQDTTVNWKIINNSDEKIWVEMYSSGAGSELLHFDKLVTLEPRKIQEVEIIVAIPDDHPDNIELRPKLFALQRGDPLAEGITGAVVNVQLKKTITIKIGDDPIFTAVVEEAVVKPPPMIIPEKEAAKAKTIQEKLAEIEARNKALLQEAETVQVAETPQVAATETPEVKDSGYIEEPVADLPKCGFWEMILSWFGIKSDCI